MTGSFGDCQMHESIFCISFPVGAKTKVLAERLVIRIKTLCKFNPISIRSGIELDEEKGGALGREKHLKQCEARSCWRVCYNRNVLLPN